jgi:hypothetical protein
MLEFQRQDMIRIWEELLQCEKIAKIRPPRDHTQHRIEFSQALQDERF